MRERRRIRATSRPPPLPLPLPTRGRGIASRRPAASTFRFCTLLCGSRVAAAALFEEVFQMFRMLALACAFALSAGPVLAQQPAAPAPSAATLPYGPPITLDQAQRALAAAALEGAEHSSQAA